MWSTTVSNDSPTVQTTSFRHTFPFHHHPSSVPCAIHVSMPNC